MGSIIERIGKKGVKKYTVRIRRKGHKLICKTFSRKTDALNFIRDTETDIERGVFKYYKASKLTLMDLINKYQNECLDEPKNKYHRASRTMLEWWGNKIGMMYLATVTPDVITEHIQLLKQEDIHIGSPNNKNITKRTYATVNRYIAALSAMFTKAYEEYQWIAENPMRRIKKLKESRGRTRFLSDDELKRLLCACKQMDSPYIFVFVCLGLFTGARYNEILSLKKQDVDLRRGLIILNDTKNGETRAVGIYAPLIPYLNDLMENPPLNQNSQYLFSRKDGKKPICIRKKWNEVLKLAGIENFRYHDLRHTTASFLAMNGANTLDIAAILGHKTLSMTKRYSHLTCFHSMKVLHDMNSKKYTSTGLLELIQK